MLTQLLEHLVDSLNKLADASDQIAKDGQRLPLEYWRGFSMGLRFTALDVRDVMRTAPEDQDPDMAYLDRLLYDWIEAAMDYRDGVGVYDYAGKPGEALYFHGQVHGYEHAYRELNAIVEYVRGDGQHRVT